MAQARRTNQDGRRGDPARAAYGRIHNRAHMGTGRPAGGQVSGPFQRPGASASRTGSSPEQPQKHAACRPGENNLLEIITLLAPSWGHATFLPQLATSLKRQASSVKLPKSQAFLSERFSSFKRQASSPSHRGASFKPQATSCKQLDPS